MRRLLLSCAFVGVAATLVAAQSDVAAALSRYYSDGVEPDWRRPLQRLRVAEGAERAEAEAFIIGLLGRALADERSGRAPWRVTGDWVEPSENPARELRRKIAHSLQATVSPRSGLLGVCRWFIDTEPERALQVSALEGLRTVRSPEADALFLTLVGRPHANAAVVAGALESIGERKLAIPAETLAPLCIHHRQSIRRAAREVARILGRPSAGEFDAAAAIQSERIQALLARVAKFVELPVAADAAFVEVAFCPGNSWSVDSDTNEAIHEKRRGWIVKQTSDQYVLATPHARVWAVPKRCAHEEHRPATVRPIPIAEEVARVARLRETGDEDGELSRMGLGGVRVNGGPASVYEIVLAHWLNGSERFALAAKVLFPALETLYSDEDLVEIARLGFGDALGHRMLVAFIGDRDYGRAVEIARRIVRRYPDTRFSEDASRLVDELPRRRSDFRDLVLPTPSDWDKMRERLTREQQLVFLCKRLRLLNCFQEGQPGGISYPATQYREPCGLSIDAAWDLLHGRTEVINPYRELTGAKRWWGEGEPETEGGLSLTVADIPRLAEFLRESWLILAVDFWRDYDPDRALHTTREIFSGIINAIAHYPLCDVRALAKSPSEVDRTIERLRRWAKRHAGKPRRELLIAALERALAEKRGWRFVEEQTHELVDARAKEIVPLLLGFLARPGLSRWDLADLLHFCRTLEPAACSDVARRLSQHSDAAVRAEAAAVLVATGHVDEGRPVLAKLLRSAKAHGLGSRGIRSAVEALLDEGSEDSRRAASRVLTRDGALMAMYAEDRVRILRRFADLDVKATYAFYKRGLTSGGSRQRHDSSRVPTREELAREIFEHVAQNVPRVQQIATRWRDDPKARIEALIRWLDTMQ